MQNIELYIEGQRLDLFNDESVSLTQTIKNARDVAKVFTSFTKTFNVPSSKTNNKIFKHYYNFNIDGGFDARTKVSGTIELNGFPFKDGKIKLEGVKLKENQAYSYKITFFGNTVNLKDLVGEAKLNQLFSLNSISPDYNYSSILGALQADPATNDLITPLITSGASGITQSRLYYDSDNHGTANGNLYYHTGGGSNANGVLWSDLKFALRVDKIVQAITASYPSLAFSNDFFTSSNLPYYNLFMWLHRKKGSVQNESDSKFTNLVNGWTVQTDLNSSMINTSTLKITGPSVTTAFLRLNRSNTTPYDVIVKRNGQTIEAESNVTLTNKIIVVSATAGDEFTVTINYLSSIIFNFISWTVVVPSGTDETFSTGSYILTTEFEFVITSEIPDIKIIDFLSGLFKMFNLVAFVDNTGKVVVNTLDSFYSIGINYDISQYIDINSSEVNVALPYKEIVFDYKDNNTFLAATHSQQFSYTWGKESYNNNENLDGSIYKVELPFAHFKFERIVNVATATNTPIQWGYCVDDNQEPYIGLPFLFYANKVTSSSFPISFLTENSLIPYLEIQNYNVPSNSLYLDPATGKDNINFKNEINEYTGDTSFTDTLFQKHYSNYIGNIFNNKNRLTKVTAYLPLKILLNFSLADRFDINGQRYKINSIKTNLKTGKSDIELLNEL
tara:strand:+ start:4786 stop:6804 length:2019 start_codon:yes stop_codon:yes gene_type:complete